MWFWFLCVAAAAVYSAEGAGVGAARLICYVEGARASDFTECTHLVYAGNARGDKLTVLLKEFRKNNPRLKIILRVTEVDKDLPELLKSKYVQGLEVYGAHLSFNKSKVLETVEAVKAAISSSGGGPLFLALPAHPELLAKYYDLRVLMKKVDLMMVQTHALGLVKKMTYHPSRLSGLWDMMNTDSVVDLVVGLGVPASKLVISLPATARQFTLLNETLSTPGSPTTEEDPKEIDQAELCRQLQEGRWTLERDQDLSAPYAFKDNTWISFEDSSSVDVKGKYARVRGLAGLALAAADRDTETPCGPTLRTTLTKVLNQQSRAPRAAVLRSLENEILSAPGNARVLDALQVSPYRITQIVDSDGVIHSIREDTRTEFSCSRQGYFVHPRSCARFYRCVKFDQLSPDYTVFEFDCPAGLAFDARYEVCVWPGSLPHSQACPGSSEIAPVPRTRFVCPEGEGYYADPENCRWFFACLDHGKSPLSAYEFRCPFGLGFDAARLKCDWPWLVPACGNVGRYEAEAFGFSGAILNGAAGFGGKTADSINIAGHQSLVSGASLNNLVGIQSGLLTKDDVLDNNYITSHEAANGFAGVGTYEVDSGFPDLALGGQGESSGISYNIVPAGTINDGLLENTNYNGEDKYASGSIILDDYRLPGNTQSSSASTGSASVRFNTGKYNADSSGKYRGSDAGKYRANVAGQYTASDTGRYRASDAGRYRASDAGQYRSSETGKYKASDAGQYRVSDAGQYRASETGKYIASDDGKYRLNDAGKYRASDAGQYRASEAGQYRASTVGLYKSDSSGKYKGNNAYPGVTPSYTSNYVNGFYKKDNSGRYVHNPAGDRAKPYEHVTIDPIPYLHTDQKYQNPSEYDVGRYSGSYNTGSSLLDENRGLGGYAYPKPAIEFNEGPGEQQSLYSGTIQGGGDIASTYQGSYTSDDLGSYVSDDKVYTGASHTLTAGAINVGLVGKTSLVDANYLEKGDYQKGSYNHAVVHQTNVVAEPAVSVSHVGTDNRNLDGYSFITTPTSSGIPTTATPLPVTTYKTTYVPELPKTSIKQIFGYTQPAVTVVQPTVVAVKQFTPAVQVTNQGSSIYSTDYNSGTESNAKTTGYVYVKPNIQFHEGITYTTPTPYVTVTKQIPNGFSQSHQTVHNVQSAGYQYSTAQPVNEPPFKKIIAYTTGQPETYVQPTAETFSQQNLQTIISNNNRGSSDGFVAVHNDIPQVSQDVISTLEPQSFSQQTLHTVGGGSYSQSQSENGYFSQQQSQNSNIEGNSESGYKYTRPSFKLVDTHNVGSTNLYKPQSYSSQTIHNVKTTNYVPVTSTISPISVTPVTVYENPLLKYTQKITPANVLYTQSYNEQTNERGGYTKSVIDSDDKLDVRFNVPQTTIFSTAHPAYTIRSSTSGPTTFSQQTLHTVDGARVTTQEGSSSGYDYSRPVDFEQVNTYVPSVTSTVSPSYSSQSYKQRIVQKVIKPQIVSSTPLPKVELTYQQQPTVSIYENPILKYTQKVTPVSYVEPTATIYTQTYKPTSISSSSSQNIVVDQTGYSGSNSQQNIREDTENSFSRGYSDASVVSHQEFHQTHSSPNNQYLRDKNVVFISTTPANLVYEDHYAETESPIESLSNKAPEYTKFKNNYQQISVSTNPTPVYRQNSVVSSQDQIDYKPVENFQQTDYQSVGQVEIKNSPYSVDTASAAVAAFPATKINEQYNRVAYQSPEIQVTYKAEEYLPPIVSTTSYYRPAIYTTSTSAPEYLPPNGNTYLPPTNAKPKENTLEYLPPALLPKVINYESFGYNNGGDILETNNYSLYQQNTANIPRKHNIVVETSKSNILGFGTVGPNAGLVSTTYTTAHPYISSTDNSYLPPQTASFAYPSESVTSVPRRTRPILVKQIVKSTTPTTYVQSSTDYKAPEYLPPTDEISQENFAAFGFKSTTSSPQIKYNPFRQSVTIVPFRKQNIVVETAKSQLLGFDTVGSNAGLVTGAGYTTTQTPHEVSSSTPVSSLEEEFFTPTRIPSRKYKPKVAVVTKINDFNPLLVRKLGAVCSCQSPVLVLKGRRPTVQIQSSEYDDAERGDIDDVAWEPKSTKVSPNSITNTVTVTPIVTSTFNPIIVPEDTFYQDYPESSNDNIAITSFGGDVSGRTYNTPVTSTTERIVQIIPHSKAVTVAPTYRTVLSKQKVSPTVISQQSESTASAIDSQSFDRYGPGGWRGRDETLQGSVDCQRAGLFRHPKQCNKFYACRWDCTKQRFTLHIFNCPVQLSFDPNIGACNWPSQGPSCQGDTLLNAI